jgi:endonuclease YncB( thermonuclease family)
VILCCEIASSPSLWQLHVYAETISGVPVVHDADTLRFGRVKIHLSGIDAQELRQPSGRQDRDVLKDMVATGGIRCDWKPAGPLPATDWHLF